MKQRLWTYAALAEAVGAEAGADAVQHPDIAGIAIDSRRTEPGDLFVALAGDAGPRFATSARSTRDGHDFVADAVQRGAVAVLVHRPGDYPAPSLVVEDTLDALWDVGRAARRRLAGPVVAVTGSNGKTTFKSFASAALGACATAGSLNNHLGVPLSLGRTPKDATSAVYEIGTSYPGEIEPLARLVEPDVAVLLNVHAAHIEHFGTVDAIRHEKASIAKGLRPSGVLVRPGGLAVDFPGRSVTFGTQGDCDVRLAGLADGFADIRTPNGGIACPVPGGGAHRALTVAALAAVLVALEAPLGHLDRLAGVEVPRGRGNRLDVSGVTIIDESYNANPASMAATLELFSAEAGRRIAILGDMRELGPGTERYHEELRDQCHDLDGVFCAGKAIGALYNALPGRMRLGFADRADGAFATHCALELKPGDRVLVKGSNAVFWSNGFVERLAEALRQRR